MPLHKNMRYKNGRTEFKGILRMVEDSLLSSSLVSCIILFYKTQVGRWNDSLKKIKYTNTAQLKDVLLR